MEVDPAALRAAATQFGDTAAAMRAHGKQQHSGVDEEIAALGEIYGTLHNLWRAVRGAQAQAWAGLADAHDDHADKLTTVATNYESTDGGARVALGTTETTEL